MPLLPPVIATLLADTKEYMAKMDEAEHKMGKFGAASDVAGAKFNKFANLASDAVIGVGAAITAYGVDKAIEFQKSLDALQNQAGYTAKQADEAGKSILNISNATGIASSNIASAYLQAAKAGISQAHAQQLINDAAETAVITGGDVTSTTQTLIGIENLQIAKGMSVAQVSDLMVMANKRHVGSLDTLTSSLTGKVGGALAAAGVNLAEIAAVSEVASRAGYDSAKSYTALATGLNKIESPTAKSAKAMGLLGINAQTLATTARHPGTGLVDVLEYLEKVSKRTGTSMNTLISGTFGPGSVGMVTDLANHIGTLAGNVKALGGASGGGLQSAFSVASKQLDVQMKIIEQRLINSATMFGLKLMPYVANAANVLTNSMDYLAKHPAAVGQIGIGIATALSGALAFKAAGVGVTIAEAFGATIAGGTALLIGAAVSAGVLGALEIWKYGKQPESDYLKAHNELQRNKAGGIYDIAALVVNTITSAANHVITKLPGNPYIPALPILGSTVTNSTQAPGMLGNLSPLSPGFKGKTTINVTVAPKGKAKS